MNTRAQLWCAATGPIMVVLWVVSFVILAGFIPPPDPSDSPEEILELFREDTDAIRLGLIITAAASALLVPWAIAITVQMRRIEGPHSVLAFTQGAQGTLVSLEFIISCMIWQTIAFRPDEYGADAVRMLNDLGWIFFVANIFGLVIQVVVFGIGVLLDKRSEPIFPRWFGYFTVWAGIMFMPAGIVVFFKDGAFAWNGLLSFWTVLVVFCAWVMTAYVMLVRAIRQQALEAELESVA